MTREQIRDKIQLDADVLGDEMFPNKRLHEMINEGIRTLQVKLNGLGMDKWETNQNYTSFTSTTFYNQPITTISLPTDYLEGNNLLHAETISNTINGLAYETTFTKFPELLINSYLKPSNNKPAFVRVKNQLYIYPRVTTFNLYYRKVLADLTSDSSIPEIPLEFHPLIVDWVVTEIKKIKNVNFIPDLNKLNQDVEETYVKHQRNKQEKKDDTLGN